jgi:hypothetical protein
VAKDFYISNIKASNAKNAFVASGLEKSTLKNFIFSNSAIAAESLGTMELTEGWKFNNLKLDIKKKIEQKAIKPEGIEHEERLKG